MVRNNKSGTRAFITVMMLALFLGYLVFYMVFFSAYTSPTKQVVVDVNMFGEADVEIIGFTMILLLGFLAVILSGFNSFAIKKKDKIEWIVVLSSIVFLSLLFIIIVFVGVNS